MKKQLKQVNKFHKAFNIGQAPKAPTLIYENEYKLRHNLASEELNEYLEACKSGDLVEVADALGDQLYILCGTILAHGMQNVITDVFDEIHNSNMSKLDKDGNPIFREDGKVLKGENYFRPELQKFIK
jgi:predicted HAD superfamily Cof-like phosphohydrolase